MKKVLYLCLSLVLVQTTHASDSCWEKILNGCCKFDIGVGQLFGKDDQEVMSEAVRANNYRKLKQCLILGVGDLTKEDAEGHTAVSIAQLLDNKECMTIIKKELNKLSKTPSSPKSVDTSFSPHKNKTPRKRFNKKCEPVSSCY